MERIKKNKQDSNESKRIRKGNLLDGIPKFMLPHFIHFFNFYLKNLHDTCIQSTSYHVFSIILLMQIVLIDAY